jgi:hypothetical protein
MDWQPPKLYIERKIASRAGFRRLPVGQFGRFASSKHPVNIGGTFESMSVTPILAAALGEFWMWIVQILRLTEAERVVHSLRKNWAALVTTSRLFASADSHGREARTDRAIRLDWFDERP